MFDSKQKTTKQHRTPTPVHRVEVNILDLARDEGETPIPFDDQLDLPIGPDRVSNLDTDREIAAQGAYDAAFPDEAEDLDVIGLSGSAVAAAERFRGEHRRPTTGLASADHEEHDALTAKIESTRNTPGAGAAARDEHIGMALSLAVGVGDAALQFGLWSRNGIDRFTAVLMSLVSAATIVACGKWIGVEFVNVRVRRKNGIEAPGDRVAVEAFYGPADTWALRIATMVSVGTAVVLPVAFTMMGFGNGDPFMFAAGFAALTAVGISGSFAGTAFGHAPVRDQLVSLQAQRSIVRGRITANTEHAARAAEAQTTAALNAANATLRARAAAAGARLLMGKAKRLQPFIEGVDASATAKAVAGLDANGVPTSAPVEVTFATPTVDLSVPTTMVPARNDTPAPLQPNQVLPFDLGDAA